MPWCQGIKGSVCIGVDPCCDLGIEVPSQEWVSLFNGKEEVHEFSWTWFIEGGSGLNISSLNFPCLSSVGTEYLSVDGGKFWPLVVKPPGVEGVAGASVPCGIIDPDPLGLSGEGVHAWVRGIGVAVLGGPGMQESCMLVS